MACIVVGSYVARYPLGGNLSWTLQWLLGFRQLGHDVYLVEKANYPEACYDPVRRVEDDDCSYGVGVVRALLKRFELDDKWCFVDLSGRFYGLSRERIQAVLRSADLFVDLGTHGAWLDEASAAGLRVLVEGEPGYTQMEMEMRRGAGEQQPFYDYYYTNGANIGTARSKAPTAGKEWRPVYNPVVVELFPTVAPAPEAPFTTVMNWQSHDPFSYRGTVYGQKDVEFIKFLDLPGRTTAPMEIAVSGDIPTQRLTGAGWRVRNAQEVTASYESFRQYLEASRGEFSVCKQGYVVLNTGWFSDRSAAYLASGRPVVMQDTGFSAHLPCGQGLFAVRTMDEAAWAVNEICGAYERHARAAREIASQHLEARSVLRRFLNGLGV